MSLLELALEDVFPAVEALLHLDVLLQRLVHQPALVGPDRNGDGGTRSLAEVLPVEEHARVTTRRSFDLRHQRGSLYRHGGLRLAPIDSRLRRASLSGRSGVARRYDRLRLPRNRHCRRSLTA